MRISNTGRLIRPLLLLAAMAASGSAAGKTGDELHWFTFTTTQGCIYYEWASDGMYSEAMGGAPVRTWDGSCRRDEPIDGSGTLGWNRVSEGATYRGGETGRFVNGYRDGSFAYAAKARYYNDKLQTYGSWEPDEGDGDAATFFRGCYLGDNGCSRSDRPGSSTAAAVSTVGGQRDQTTNVDDDESSSGPSPMSLGGISLSGIGISGGATSSAVAANLSGDRAPRLRVPAIKLTTIQKVGGTCIDLRLVESHLVDPKDIDPNTAQVDTVIEVTNSCPTAQLVETLVGVEGGLMNRPIWTDFIQLPRTVWSGPWPAQQLGFLPMSDGVSAFAMPGNAVGHYSERQSIRSARDIEASIASCPFQAADHRENSMFRDPAFRTFSAVVCLPQTR